ncbi:tRNA synthetases class I (M)-domain-containing protein [Xylariaceae sp. FL1651]|nr:tRNA synthetases class I (M)-domain-containing protein [Xylariaceae sp. FL1651]
MGSVSQPLLPEPGKRNILITSALPYVNNVPHLGNIIGSVLSADVFARFCRARGLKTLYICGSDEYGTATETKALEEGLTPAELCAKYHKIHKDIYDWFRIQFDIFGRTPTAQHTEIVQSIFSRLWENGFIEERETIQPYCPSHQSFLADRFVEGECSICHYADARGDQCDACGNLLDPLEPVAEANDVIGHESKGTGWLLKPRCKLDGATPEPRKTKHLFLRLDALKDDIISWFNVTNKEWSANCIAITQSWIDRGLQARGITRDLKWGVPIPKGLKGLSDEEYKNKVFYVWFDACIGYPSITKNYTDGDDLNGRNWEKWWKNPDDVTLYQFMGKDNVPFHSIIFPGSQLGTKETWTKVGRFSTTEYLNYEGGKFSKSRGIGVFGNSAKNTGVDVDVWRFFLLSRRPETSDAEFKWDEFVDVNNNDLLKNLGNLCQRVIKFCHAKLDATIPDYRKYTSPALDQHKADVNSLLQNYISNMEAIKLRQGLNTILNISALGNKLLQDNKLSNQLLAEEPERCAGVVGLALNHIHLVANILCPYMPGTAQSILQQLGVPPEKQTFTIPDVWTGNTLEPGEKIGTPTLLFSQIPTARAEEWREAYGGDELKKQKAAEAEKAAAKKAAKQKKKEEKSAQKAAVAAAVAGKSDLAEGFLDLFDEKCSIAGNRARAR